MTEMLICCGILVLLVWALFPLLGNAWGKRIDEFQRFQKERKSLRERKGEHSFTLATPILSR